MKTLKFISEDNNIDVEYLVDLIGDNDMMTVYQITQYVSGVKQVNLNGTAQAFGMFDKIDQTVNDDNSRTKYTLVDFIAFAVTKNLTLEVYEDGESTLTKNTLTALAITTESIDAGVAGLAQVETLTIPATADATQGDYIILTNALSQETVAVWLDIDADGTAPTGAKYAASDYQVEVDIVTGGTATANGALVEAALALETDWAGEVTLLDNEDGTIDVTQDYNGVVAEADPENADDSGAGSITASTGTTGTAGTAYDFDFEAEGGSTPYIWTTASTLPEGITLSTAGNLAGTPREVGTFPLTVVVTDFLGVTDTLTAEDFVVSATA